MTTFRFQHRRDTAANWTSVNPVLRAGEPAMETDTGRQKMGDGVTAWANLPYVTPRIVPNGFAPASLVTALAGSKTVEFAPGATVTLTSTAHRLTQPAGSVLDLKGSTISYGYTDDSNATNFNAQDICNGTVELASGKVIKRLMRFSAPYGRMQRVTVRAVDQTNNIDDNNDAAIRVDATGFVSQDCVLENLRLGYRVSADGAYFRNLKCRKMWKGIDGIGGGAIIDGMDFDGIDSGAGTDPGNNAIGGEWKFLWANRIRVNGAGEHNIYLAGAGKYAGGEVYLNDVRSSRSGQCSGKFKDYTRLDIRGWHGSWTSFGNTPGLNEEGMRIQRCALVTGGGINITKEIVDGADVGNAGFSHIFLSGNDTVRLLIESYGRGCGRGVVFGVDDSDATIAHGNGVIRVRHDNLLGPAVVIEDGAIINGLNIVFVELDGCATSPVLIGEGVTYGPNGKLLVIGTYKGCASPPPASTANVDLSMFVPFGEVNIAAGNIANAYFAANASSGVFQPIQSAVIDITTPALTSGLGGMHISGATLGTSALGDLTTGISLSRKGSNRRGALIAGKLTGTDVNQMGVAVLTKGSTTAASHAVVERVVIDHLGNTYPGADNAQTFGSATMRWSTAFTTALKNGQSNTIAFGGIADPAYAQHHTGGSNASFAMTRWTASASGPQHILGKSRGAAVGTYAALSSSDNLGDYQFWGDNGAAMAPGAIIRATAIEAWTATANGTRLAFFACPVGAAATTEVARLEAATGLSMFGANPVIDANRLFRTRPYTVATLPTVGTSDRLCSVTDASAPSWNATLAGGGAVRCLAYDNGTNWTAH